MIFQANRLPLAILKVQVVALQALVAAQVLQAAQKILAQLSSNFNSA